MFDYLLTLIKCELIVEDHLIGQYFLDQRKAQVVRLLHKGLGECIFEIFNQFILNLTWPILIVLVEAFNFKREAFSLYITHINY